MITQLKIFLDKLFWRPNPQEIYCGFLPTPSTRVTAIRNFVKEVYPHVKIVKSRAPRFANSLNGLQKAKDFIFQFGFKKYLYVPSRHLYIVCVGAPNKKRAIGPQYPTHNLIDKGLYFFDSLIESIFHFDRKNAQRRDRRIAAVLSEQRRAQYFGFNYLIIWQDDDWQTFVDKLTSALDSQNSRQRNERPSRNRQYTTRRR